MMTIRKTGENLSCFAIILLCLLSCAKEPLVVEQTSTWRFENFHCCADREFLGDMNQWIAQWYEILQKSEVHFADFEVGFDQGLATQSEICDCGNKTGHYFTLQSSGKHAEKLQALDLVLIDYAHN